MHALNRHFYCQIITTGYKDSICSDVHVGRSRKGIKQARKVIKAKVSYGSLDAV